ncbi:hypothetical protein SPRG_14642 [Saprolegnia parasitica CBS 223.65]|uniref:Uncharacterized protein n=1 Tax=Saprolegnia parasitica (strain CBS 223.65) TaxID=695850 RepID=A0A067BPC3_SAPPC|nr:hypothetical protein SPRG_14642 [Saprolegnia parasitica CBS 223.65]KDO20103.1 hypothetical protein SPRG_14642 [Saprolegnia parasitica CBS 223.65]|eukprot:XP_012209206.1 hypothetical protein SPRG_14642 [Saprolegnia parasitica CBS 223.65]
MLQIARHPAEAGTAEWTVFFVAIGLYPAVAVTVWRWNRRRAVLFQVPNLSLLDALQHESDRVRAIAAVTVTLETAERDMKSLQSILLALDACLTRPRVTETTFAAAYACQATWFLWYTNFDLRDYVAESEAEPIVPFGCWVHPTSSRSSLATKTAVPFRQRLSLSGRIMPWRLGTKSDSFVQQPASLAHAFLVAPTPLDSGIKPRGVLRGGPTDQSALLQLVEKATDLAHAVCMTTRIMDNTAIRFCFQHAVKTLAELCRSSCRRSRLLASKVLQEMYQAGVVQVSPTTFFYVAANLTVSSSYTKAASAARTLVQIVNDHDDVWVARHMADAITLRLVVDAMHLHRLDRGFVASLLTVLLQGLTTLTTLGGRGPNAATYLDRSLVAALLELQCHPLSALAAARLDDVLATLHEIWENRPNRLRRIVKQMSKTRILVRSIARPSDAAYTLVTTAQLKLIHDRQRTRSELVATIHSVLAEGLASSARQSDLSDTVQATVAMLSPLLSTRSDLLSYIHSQLTTAEYWYLCDLIGRPRPRNATAATRSREDR